MNKKIRQKVYEKYGCRCAYCGCKLPDRWHVDHLFPKQRENDFVRDEKFAPLKNSKGEYRRYRINVDDFKNLYPACPECNMSKSTLFLSQFRKWLQNGITKWHNKNDRDYRMAKKFGLIKEDRIKVKFYFEQVSNNE